MEGPELPARNRPDACPGVLDAAPAADGLTARVRLPGGAVPATALAGLADFAVRFGTGALDLTARANLQIRGLDEAGLRELAARLTHRGLFPAPSHDRVRNIVAGPLAGRDPRALIDAEAIVRRLDAELCADPALAALPGRFLFSVDDGGLPVASAGHDVSLLAVAPGEVALLTGGTDTGVRVPAAGAVGAALGAARAFLRARAGTDAWHVRELPGGARTFARGLGPGGPARPRGGIGPAGMTGVLAQSDGRSAVAAVVPLGRLTPRHVHALAGFPGARIRITPWRGVVLGDLDDAPGAVAALEQAGLGCAPDSPWRGVGACSGLGACRKALTDVRAHAAEAVRSGAAGPVYWSACPRGCGRPEAGAAVTASGDGGYTVSLPGARPRTVSGPAEVYGLLRHRAGTRRDTGDHDTPAHDPGGHDGQDRNEGQPRWTTG